MQTKLLFNYEFLSLNLFLRCYENPYFLQRPQITYIRSPLFLSEVQAVGLHSSVE
jgi:hypothetical protein